MASTTIIGLGIAAAAAVAGTVTSIHAINANKQAVKDSNQANSDTLHEQMAYQTGEREAVQEYNTPQQQVQRWRNAGINPYLALGQLESGNAVAQSSPSGSPAIPAQLSAPDFSGLFGLSDKVQQAAQTESLNLDNDAKRINNQTLALRNVIEIENEIARLENQKVQTDDVKQQIENKKVDLAMAREQLDYFRSTKSDSKEMVKLGRLRMEIENDIAAVNYEVQQFAASMKPKEYELLCTAVNEAHSRILFNKASAASAYANMALSYASARGVHLDNYQKTKINWILRKQAWNEVRLQDKNMKLLDAQYASPWNLGARAIDNEGLTGVNNGHNNPAR